MRIIRMQKSYIIVKKKKIANLFEVQNLEITSINNTFNTIFKSLKLHVNKLIRN